MGSLLVVACLVAGSSVASSAQSDTTVALHSEVVVDSRDVTLGQVAAITGEATVTDGLGRVCLGSGPVPGGTRRIEIGFVKYRLKRYGFDPDLISLQGECVVVRRDAPRPALRPNAAPIPGGGGSTGTGPAPEATPLVLRNQPVKVRVQCGGVFITATARACEDGYLGEVVRARLRRTNRTVEGRVMGPAQLLLTIQGEGLR